MYIEEVVCALLNMLMIKNNEGNPIMFELIKVKSPLNYKGTLPIESGTDRLIIYRIDEKKYRLSFERFRKEGLIVRTNRGVIPESQLKRVSQMIAYLCGISVFTDIGGRAVKAESMSADDKFIVDDFMKQIEFNFNWNM